MSEKEPAKVIADNALNEPMITLPPSHAEIQGKTVPGLDMRRVFELAPWFDKVREHREQLVKSDEL
jgi:hypothetical protein